MTIRAGPLLWSLINDGTWTHAFPALAGGAVLLVLIAVLLVALLLDRRR